MADTVVHMKYKCVLEHEMMVGLLNTLDGSLQTFLCGSERNGFIEYFIRYFRESSSPTYH